MLTNFNVNAKKPPCQTPVAPFGLDKGYLPKKRKRKGIRYLFSAFLCLPCIAYSDTEKGALNPETRQDYAHYNPNSHFLSAT